MSVSVEAAMDVIRDEIAKEHGKRYVEVVGEYLTEYLRAHPESAEKLAAEGKSIAGSLEAMKAEARKAAVGGVGVLDDETAFGIVLRYYGIEPGAEAASAPEPEPEQKPETGGAMDDLSLDALLGGL